MITMPKTPRGQQERLIAIEILVLWEGRVTRSRMAELFDVHGTLLSRDMAHYVELAPDNCRYDTSMRGYERTTYARPKLTQGEFMEYEQLVGTASQHGLRAGVDLLTAKQDATVIAYHLFSRLHAAIRQSEQVQIEYRSLSNPGKHNRIIRPHAFIQAGPRWHVRAYCKDSQAFRDFNLGRISVVGDPEATDLPGPIEDGEWNTIVKLRFVPHPGLSTAQAKLIRDEYMGGTNATVFNTRQPIAKYIVHAHRAAVDPELERAPDYLLAVHAPKKLPAGTLLSKWVDGQ